MNGAQLVLECLKKLGVDTIFGYPGGAVIPLYDALYDYDDFLHIRTSHEQGLVHAADGYARSTGKVGVCITTSGPGASNAITGIATAYMDSTPMVVLSGQVPRAMLGKDSFQEIDTTGMNLSITKHTFSLRDTKEIVPAITEAFKIANSGRKGPVVIDIPKDLFTSEIDFEPFTYESTTDYSFKPSDNFEEEIKSSFEIIKSAKKPVIYAGGGIKNSGAEKELLEFAEKFDIPVLNSLMGLGSFDRSHKLSLGLMGMHGFRECNFSITNSDLVIALGVRFSDRGTGRCSAFASNARIIHVETDRSELEKNIKVHNRVVGDVGCVLKAWNKMMGEENLDHSEWKEEINTYKQKDNIGKGDFHPKNILRLSSEVFGKNTVVSTDVGQHQMWAAQHWDFDNDRSFITSGGLGTMGFGLGAAIGAKLGCRDKHSVLVTGDGSFKMNMNELPTLSDYNIPLTILLFKNNSLGMVRQWQKLFSEERYSETNISSNVDFVALAKACGVGGVEVSTMEELEIALRNTPKDKPYLIQCNIDKNYDVFPIVPPNEVLENIICD